MAHTASFGILIPDAIVEDGLLHQLADMAQDIEDALILAAGGTGSTLGLSDPGSPGFVVRTSAGTTVARQLIPPGEGFTIIDQDGIAGNPVFALQDDLAAVEGLSGTGFARRTGPEAWALSATINLSSEVSGSLPWASVNKTGSSLGDLATRSAADLSSGTLLAARLPAFSGDVSTGAGDVVTTIGPLKVLNSMIANSTIDLTTKVTNVLPAVNGGTGQSAYAVGDLLYASGAAALSKLAGVATGNVLISGGVATAPSWAKVGLTTHVSGILPSANGGTGIAFFAAAGPSILRTYTFPDADSTIARTDSGQTFTGTNNFGNVFPSLTDTYDLGEPTKLWRKGWLSELDTILFSKNTQTLIGGWLVLTKNEGAIPVGQDVGAGDATIDFGQAMTLNDFVEFRSSLAVEYVQVGALSSGTRYNVTRNLDGSGANAWPAGNVYRVNGNTTNGRIELNANSSPRISLLKQGAAYNSQTEVLRIGDLNGWGPYASETYGFVVGQYGVANQSSLTVEDSGIRFYNNITERIRLLANGSGFLANSLISWDTAGNLTVAGNAAIGGWTIGATSITSTGIVMASGANAYLSFGVIPPTSASVGTGLFQDRTGLFGLASNIVQAKFDAVTGALTAGAGAVILNVDGISIISASTYQLNTSYSNKSATGELLSAFYDNYTSTEHVTNFESALTTGRSSYLFLSARAPSGKTGELRLSSSVGGVLNGTMTLGSSSLLFEGGDTNTAGITDSLSLTHYRSIGSGFSAGAGTGIKFSLESTTTRRDAGRVASIWTTATDATRTSALVFWTVNNAAFSEAMRIAGGKVAINTTDPTFGGVVVAGLSVAAVDSTASAIAVGNTSGVPRFALNPLSSGGWTMYDYGGGSWYAAITSVSGKVGLGMTPGTFVGGQFLQTPGSTTQSSASFGGLQFQSYTADNGWISNNLYYNASWKYVAVGYGTYMQLGAGLGDIIFGTAPNGSYPASATVTERMRITNNGNVGIGTGSPGINLQANALTILSPTTRGMLELATSQTNTDGLAVGQIGMFATTNTGGQQITAILGLMDGGTANNRGGQLYFYAKPNAGSMVNPQIIIRESGQTIIHKDSVWNTGGGTRFQSGVTGNYYSLFVNTDATNGICSIQSYQENVGVKPLYINGIGGAVLIGGTVRISAYGAGTLVTDASGNITASSDLRLKTVHGPFTRGLEALRSITPIMYSWNREANRRFGMEMKFRYPGFSAQELRGPIPEAVFEGGDFLNFYDRGLQATMVNSIKQLDVISRRHDNDLDRLYQIIATQGSTIAAQAKEIEELRGRLQ